jgi:hypothetical protein
MEEPRKDSQETFLRARLLLHECSRGRGRGGLDNSSPSICPLSNPADLMAGRDSMNVLRALQFTIGGGMST